MEVVNVKVKYIRPKYNNLKEWIADENNIYIGRGGVVFIDGKRYPPNDSILANPFKIGKDSSRDEVIERYRIYLLGLINDGVITKEYLLSLRNKTLGCWCAPERCHGHVVLEIVQNLSNS